MSLEFERARWAHFPVEARARQETDKQGSNGFTPSARAKLDRCVRALIAAAAAARAGRVGSSDLKTTRSLLRSVLPTFILSWKLKNAKRRAGLPLCARYGRDCMRSCVPFGSRGAAPT